MIKRTQRKADELLYSKCEIRRFLAFSHSDESSTWIMSILKVAFSLPMKSARVLFSLIAL